MAQEQKTASGFDGLHISNARRHLSKVTAIPKDESAKEPSPVVAETSPAPAAQVARDTVERDNDGRILKRTNLRFPKVYADALKLLTVKRKKREHMYDLLSQAVGDFIKTQMEAGVISQKDLEDIEADVETEVPVGQE